jgi:hypothetical protein
MFDICSTSYLYCRMMGSARYIFHDQVKTIFQTWIDAMMKSLFKKHSTHTISPLENCLGERRTWSKLLKEFPDLLT